MSSARAAVAAGPAARPGPRTSAAEDAVAVAGLVKHYGHRTAVAGLDLHAARGAVTAVLGPNGAGKTTTVECCVGLRVPDGGSVRVLGLDPRRDAARLRPRVGVLLQDGGLPNGAPALGVLRHVASLHRAPMDVASLAALLERLRAAGVAVVLTTHAMEEAERLADTVVVVADGRTVATGTVADLTGSGTADQLRFGAPAGTDLTDLRLALPTTVTAVEAAPGRYEVSAGPGGAVDPQVVATVASWCASRGVMPQGLTVGRRSLEDVVLELTGGRASWQDER